MTTENKNTAHPRNQHPAILLIGRPEGALVQGLGELNNGLQLVPDAMQAIRMASRTPYGTILVIMNRFQGRLTNALETLRGINKNARIILLAQMYEEPLARQILTRQSESGPLADDYRICPVDLRIFRPEPGTAAQTAPAPSLQTAPDLRDERIRELEKLATEDDLTGLKNRRYVREFLRQILEKCSRDEMHVTLLLFDIDNFKHYNDTYGHAVGDNVLKQVAVMMRRCCREHDVIGRIGGDEFAVVFWDLPPEILHAKSPEVPAERREPHSEHPHETMRIAERFRSELYNADLTFLGPSGQGSLTISGGLAAFPRDGRSVEEMFEKADQAMLEAKRNGKNRIYIVGDPQQVETE